MKRVFPVCECPLEGLRLIPFDFTAKPNVVPESVYSLGSSSMKSSLVKITVVLLAVAALVAVGWWKFNQVSEVAATVVMPSASAEVPFQAEVSHLV